MILFMVRIAEDSINELALVTMELVTIIWLPREAELPMELRNDEIILDIEFDDEIPPMDTMLIVVLGAELVREGVFLIELELLFGDVAEDSDDGGLLGLKNAEFCTDPLAEGVAFCVVESGLVIGFESVAGATIEEGKKVDTVAETDISEAGLLELINGPDIVDIDGRELLIKTLLGEMLMEPPVGDALIEPPVGDTLTETMLRGVLEVALLKEGDAAVSVVVTLLEDRSPITDEAAEPEAIKLPDDVV